MAVTKNQNAASRHCVTYPLKAGNRAFAHLESKPIAYFCMEYGLHDRLPIFAGGLGVLAGDIFLEAGDQGVPFVAIGSLYRRGFKTYKFPKSSRLSPTDPALAGFSILKDDTGAPVILDVEINEKVVFLRVWVRIHKSAHLFLLDADIPENSEGHRRIGEHLYDQNFEVKLLQDLILGVGGVKLLRCLSISPSVYHLNEGHTSFVTLALAVEYLHDHPGESSLDRALEAVRPMIVGTKHTILSGAGLFFTREQCRTVVEEYLTRHRVNFDDFFKRGVGAGDLDTFSTTRFLIRNSIRSSAVSVLHSVFEKKEHPRSELIPVTNGIHQSRWLSPAWPKEGTMKLSDGELWATHADLRTKLISWINKQTGIRLDPGVLTVTWARRFAAYKRPEFLFSDLDRLARIVSDPERPTQFIFSGQAGISDIEGQRVIETIIEHTKDPRFKDKIVYLEDYSIRAARELVSGSDVWLNTPERGKEACGTSSMKSGLNGVLQLSTLDGWIEEADWTDKGWTLPVPTKPGDLYDLLEQEIIPLFYKRDSSGLPREWTKRMRHTMGLIEERYTSRRMLEEYFNKLYFPGADTPYHLYS